MNHMEGYNFVKGPCEPRNQLRKAPAVQSEQALENRVPAGVWGRIFFELRRYPEAFRAIVDLVRTLCPDLLLNRPEEPYPT